MSKYPNFMKVTTYYYSLCRTLSDLSWGFQIIYNGDDRDDPRIEFIYRNVNAVVRTEKEAKEWLEILEQELYPETIL